VRTSPHWYTPARLAALVAALLAEERRQGGARSTVQQFIARFAGLSGTRAQAEVARAAGLAGRHLDALVRGDDVDTAAVGLLLSAMRAQAKEVRPESLGVLGKGHLSDFLLSNYGIDPDSIKVAPVKKGFCADGLPFVLEVAFGVMAEDDGGGLAVIAGVNSSPALRHPFDELPYALRDMRLDDHDPVVLVVHLAYPGVEYTDRGKARLSLPRGVEVALIEAVTSVARGWKKAKRSADRNDRLLQQDLERQRKASRKKELSIKQAAFHVMEQAYLKVSDNNTLPAGARQIMYAARDLVLQLVPRVWKKSSYFTQKLLPAFMEAHPELTASWDVVFDARGHLHEPHTEHSVPLGTLQVRQYVRSWSDDVPDGPGPVTLPHDVETRGPCNRYRFALFVEKEGFDPLLERAQIAHRFDLALMSTKGMTVTAYRRLIERLTEQGVTVLVLRDFDKAGFTILHTMQNDTPRYRFRTRPKVIDLGLRLADVRQLGLQSEPVEYPGGKDGTSDPRVMLRDQGATQEERDFLVRQKTGSGWVGERVELNAMTSRQFIEFLERKLVEAGVAKLVPDAAVLVKAYRRAAAIASIERAIEALDEHQGDDVTIPPDLVEVVTARLAGTDLSWDEVVWRLASGDDAGNGGTKPKR
jgi:hypothetical protein